MLKEEQALFDRFQELIKETHETCEGTIEEFQELISDVFRCFADCIEGINPAKYSNSLIFWWYCEAARIFGQTYFLSNCGLYRNAFYNIRHLWELIIQALYIETNHLNCNLFTKLEILKEIEDKKEYHSRRIIEEKSLFIKTKGKNVDCKGLLINEYSELSRIIHPSHDKICGTIIDVSKTKGIPAEVKPEEVLKIFNSVKRIIDLSSFLFMIFFPEIKDALYKNTKIKKYIQKYKLNLLKKALN